MSAAHLLLLLSLTLFKITSCTDLSQQLEQQLSQTACLLRNNATLRSQFQSTVKLQYNTTTGSSEFTNLPSPMYDFIKCSLVAGRSLRNPEIEFAK